MSSTAFLFAGQGSQKPGMGVDFIEASENAKKIFDTASDILGFDLAEKCRTADETELAQTIISQPAIMAVSLAAYEAVKEKGISACALAGHSLGEYAMMTAAGMIDVPDAFRIIKARAAAMQKCAENSDGAMYAVRGNDTALIEKICSETEGYVVPVNYNSDSQTVIAGESSAAEKAAAKFTELGIRCKKLNVTAAFHSKLMQQAADDFYDSIKDFEFKAPQIPVYSNISGKLLEFPDDIPARLAKHIVSPVMFTSQLHAMQESGIDTFIELGPGKVLTGLVKKTLTDVTAMNIENSTTLENALEAGVK